MESFCFPAMIPERAILGRRRSWLYVARREKVISDGTPAAVFFEPETKAPADGMIAVECTQRPVVRSDSTGKAGD
jgi:hypothetical protein